MMTSSYNWCGAVAVIVITFVVESYGFSIGSVFNGKSQESGPTHFLGYSTSEWNNAEQATQVPPGKDLVDKLLKSYLDDIYGDYDTVSSYSGDLAKATLKTDFMRLLKRSEWHPEDGERGITLNKRMDIYKLLKDCQKGHQFDLWHRTLCARLLNI